MTKLSIEDVATFCKKKGFVFQAAEIYGGLSGFFDFGPLGVELKNNIKRTYMKEFVHKKDNIVAQDGAIITNPKVWKASGHVDNFADLIITTKTTKTKLRADHFIEDELNIPADGMSAKEINELIKKHDLRYKGEELEEVKDFNLMFEAQIGADPSKNSTSYLRPETCQSIFPNFKLVADVSRAKLPFGITQVGKAFRNEISPRDFVFRCREFEQIEMEYFFNPSEECKEFQDKHKKLKVQLLSAKTQDEGKETMEEITIEEIVKRGIINETHGFLAAEFMIWLTEKIGLDSKNLRLREHVSTELSHYSRGTVDIDYNYPFGFKEMIGIANRGDFDLKQHQEHSKSKLEFFDETSKTKLIPHVIEPSMGIERFFFAVLYESYEEDKERGNIVLKISNTLAPYKVAVFPLMNKPELTSIARKIHEELLEEDIVSFLDVSGSVGKRYARQDEIGTPYCLTVDYECIEEGKEKGTITIRDRDSTNQKRIKTENIQDTIRSLIKGKIEFKDL